MTLPYTIEELAEALRRQSLHERTILLEGNGSKRAMAGPVEETDEYVSTRNLNRVIDYEPQDLTISAEAGVPWRYLTDLLARHRQMIPLDPPFAAAATVGGVVAANCSGPRRRLYGTARDAVIGMQFATLQGNVVHSGGMVVKNVAGLDMAKLMIGSFGTLAAIAVVNFKVCPMPDEELTILAPFQTVKEAVAARDRILAGGLQPAAVDLLNPAASHRVAREGAWLLAVRAGGNRAVLARYANDSVLRDGAMMEGASHERFWSDIQEFTPRFLADHPDGAVVRASCTLKDVGSVAASFEVPVVARAGTGVCYGYFEKGKAAAAWLEEAGRREWRAVIEFASGEDKAWLTQWPMPGGDFEIMQRVKRLFDPGNVLNRGRLYRLI